MTLIQIETGWNVKLEISPVDEEIENGWVGTYGILIIALSGKRSDEKHANCLDSDKMFSPQYGFYPSSVVIQKELLEFCI